MGTMNLLPRAGTANSRVNSDSVTWTRGNSNGTTLKLKKDVHARKIFHLKAAGTTVKREIVAGSTTFATLHILSSSNLRFYLLRAWMLAQYGGDVHHKRPLRWR